MLSVADLVADLVVGDQREPCGALVALGPEAAGRKCGSRRRILEQRKRSLSALVVQVALG